MKAPARGDLRMVPGLTDTPAYRLVWQVVKPAESGPVRAGDVLRRAAQFRAASDLMIVRGIRDAREAGATWDEVGQALGITRQGAQQFLARSKPEAF